MARRYNLTAARARVIRAGIKAKFHTNYKYKYRKEYLTDVDFTQMWDSHLLVDHPLFKKAWDRTKAEKAYIPTSK